MNNTMRPSDGPTNLIATIFIHSPSPHRIDMASSSPTYANSQWRLVPSGNHFGIISLYAQEPNLAMTIFGADSEGTAVRANTWSGANEQLWTATNVVGKLWTFVSLGGHALQPASFSTGADLILGHFTGSNNPGAGQLWVYPDS
jgi:hypothetical protein